MDIISIIPAQAEGGNVRAFRHRNPFIDTEVHEARGTVL
jgi:hypothetical protein